MQEKIIEEKQVSSIRKSLTPLHQQANQTPQTHPLIHMTIYVYMAIIDIVYSYFIFYSLRTG